MKNILVPCDFSEPARQAYQFAREIAFSTGGKVWVIRSFDLPVPYQNAFDVQPYVFDVGLQADLENEAKESYAKMKDGQKLNQVNESFDVVPGSLVPVVRAFIENNKIDLVVMGTHGSEGITETLIGSNTEKVVRFSPVPVWVIRKAPSLKKIKKIVMPSTLNLDQTAFIKRVKELQKFLQAHIHILLINTPAHFQRDKDMKAALEEFASHYHLDNYSLQFRNNENEVDGIIEYVNEVDADLLLMATHARRGLAHLFVGSLTEDIVNHLDCPIWTYTLREKD